MRLRPGPPNYPFPTIAGPKLRFTSRCCQPLRSKRPSDGPQAWSRPAPGPLGCCTCKQALFARTCVYVSLAPPLRYLFALGPLRSLLTAPLNCVRPRAGPPRARSRRWGPGVCTGRAGKAGARHAQCLAPKHVFVQLPGGSRCICRWVQGHPNAIDSRDEQKYTW